MAIFHLDPDLAHILILEVRREVIWTSSLRHPDLTMSKQNEGSGPQPRSRCQQGGK